MKYTVRLFGGLLFVVAATVGVTAQMSATAGVGSETAKGGFRNESEIAAKFN